MGRRFGRMIGLLTCALALLASTARAAVEASVVKIVNRQNLFDWYSPWNSARTAKGIGSGFVISKKRIMTNAHVVSDSALLLVFLHGDPRPHEAHVTAVAHDCDLAILELDDETLLQDVPALEFDELPEIRSQVFTYGYPAGGARLSTTAGVVSRIGFQTYVHSGVDRHLVVQTDAAINPGNSGGPVLQNGKVVGVAFQGSGELENTGFFIPVEIIRHFLTDLEDGAYDGFPETGLIAASMENPAARAAAGMKEGATGVRVEFVARKCSAEGVLKKGDVIAGVDGYPVANDGTVDWQGLRLDHNVLFDRFQMGDTVDLNVIRSGVSMKIALPLNHYNPSRFTSRQYDVRPTYFIYAGLVFVPLDIETLATLGKGWLTEANQELIYTRLFRPLEEDRPFDEPCVMLLRRLEADVNAEESFFSYRIVDSVNGKRVETLKELADAFESDTNAWQVVRFRYGNRVVVLDRAKAEAQREEILKRYAIPKDRNL